MSDEWLPIEPVDSVEALAAAQKINAAATPEELFGPIPGADRNSQRLALQRRFRELALPVHPDRLSELWEAERSQAEAAFWRLVLFSKSLEQALSLPMSSAPPQERRFVSPIAELVCEPQAFAGGDFSEIWRGRTTTGMKIIVKIAREKADNSWIEKEAKTLDILAQDKDLEPLRRFLPEVIADFDEGGRRALLFDDIPDLLSVRELISLFPNGMPPADATWVARRIVAQASAAAMAGMVHGALLPDHVLVGVRNHEPRHIGWGHAVPLGGRLSHVLDRYRDYYAPELFDRAPADTTMDIYSAGQTIRRLLGGDPKTKSLPKAVPAPLAVIVGRLTEDRPERRYQSGKEALDALSGVARSLWGKRYRPLAIPDSK